jgi:multiple sugar transport system substrate-binding protein
VHGDPTFMVMENLKRQFEQIVGTDITSAPFPSTGCAKKPAQRRAQAQPLRPDRGGPALDRRVRDKGVIVPLDDVMDVDRLDPAISTPPAGAPRIGAACPMACPARPRPSFCSTARTGSREGLEPPRRRRCDRGGQHFHDPRSGRYGVAWNAARGTALGHTFMMTCADFGQPILDLPERPAAMTPTGSPAGPIADDQHAGRWRRRNT